MSDADHDDDGDGAGHVPPATAEARAFRGVQRAFERERAARDEALNDLLDRWVAALLREHPGLNVLALAAFIDPEDYRRRARVFVRTDEAFTRAWEHDARFQGEVPDLPSNDGVPAAELARIQAVAERLLPWFLRGDDGGSILAFWRAPGRCGFDSARGGYYPEG